MATKATSSTKKITKAPIKPAVKTKAHATATPASRNKPAAKAGAKLSPGERLAAARKAKAAGGPAAKKATARPARKPLPTFQAPADFKPHFVEVTVRTEKDGLLGNAIKAIRVNGRYDLEDPSNIEDKKKFDMGAYDTTTLVGIQARIAAVTFKATNEKKYPVDPKGRTEVKGAMRLPANTTFRLVLRVNRKSKDGTLSVLCKQILQAVKSVKTGKVKPVALDKKDPVYRSLRKCLRIMPAAFKDVQMPPARRRSRKSEDDGEE